MIYPTTFPVSNENPYEREVYIALSKLMNEKDTSKDEFDVFCFKKFTGEVKGEKIEYEIDFLIADKRNNKLNGLIVIEVKGNQIHYDGLKSEWIQDKRIMKTSPTTQARQNMGSILKRFPYLQSDVPIGWAVWFPKMISPGEKNLPTELGEFQYFDQIALTYTEAKIEAFFKELNTQWNFKKGAKLDTYNCFKETLIRSLGYVLPLHKQIEAADARFLEMTNEQLELLKLVGANNDVLIKGPAGSGKTIMATTIAKELAEKEKNVLLLTFNRALANNIRFGLGKPKSPEVTTYHSMARKIIDENFENWWNENSKSESFWELDIPIKLLDVEKDKLPKYDFIIIDEAQDLREEWFETIENIIDDDGGFYIFMDEDQDIFGAYSKIKLKRNLFEFPLTKNCRNTLEIINHIKTYINKEIKHPATTIEGEPIKIINYSSDTDQMNKIKNEWLRLVEEEGLKPDQIIIMMNANKKESCLNKITKFNKYKIQALDRSGRPDPKTVNYTSINTFKGLEADVIMLIDTDKPENPNKKVLYTQASRAKHLLYIFKI